MQLNEEANRIVVEMLELYENGAIPFKNVAEFALLLTGQKSVIRLVGSHDMHMRMEALCRQTEWLCERSSFMLETVRETTTHDYFQTSIPFQKDAPNDFVIFIGNANAVRSAARLEAGQFTDGEAAAIYGYPSCCALAYHDISHGENWIGRYLSNRSGYRYPYQSNKIAMLVPPYLSLHPDYFPCSVDCEKSFVLASTAEESLGRIGLGILKDIVKKHLSGLCVSLDDTVWFIGKYSESHDGCVFMDLERIFIIPLSDHASSDKPLSIQRHDNHVAVEFFTRTVEFENGSDHHHFVVFS